MKTAIMGFGTVGSGVLKVIEENQKQIRRFVGDEVKVAYILDLRDFDDESVRQRLVKDVNIILDDPEVDAVVECMGGLHPAYEFVSKALSRGKAVATSNKALVAEYGSELMHLAYEHGVSFLFEASVGGGIPVLRTMASSLAQEKIAEIVGILNGTTNYILTRMESEHLPYEIILKDAQALGYAERDPSADVDGYDACRKLAIMASMVTGRQISYKSIPTKGITDVTLEEIDAAKEEGSMIRLIARAEFPGEGKEPVLEVAPMKIDFSHPLSCVHGVYNGILIRGNMVDDILLVGQGAGKEATASAVAADVINALRDKKEGRMEAPLY